jgi:predicted nucleic acid-binding Zn ribbon protein
VSPVRDDSATIPCPVCGLAFEPSGRRQYCSTPCRQAAFRNKNAAPRKPVVAKAATVYQCPLCEERYLGDQYCNDCGAF